MSEREDDRLEQLEECKESYGEDFEETFKPGSFGFHELIDRASIMANIWDYVAEHPSCISDPDLYKDAQEIQMAIADFYQKAALKHLDK